MPAWVLHHINLADPQIVMEGDVLAFKVVETLTLSEKPQQQWILRTNKTK